MFIPSLWWPLNVQENQDVWDTTDAFVDNFAYGVEEKEYKYGREQHLDLTPLFRSYFL